AAGDDGRGFHLGANGGLERRALGVQKFCPRTRSRARMAPARHAEPSGAGQALLAPVCQARLRRAGDSREIGRGAPGSEDRHSADALRSMGAHLKKNDGACDESLRAPSNRRTVSKSATRNTGDTDMRITNEQIERLGSEAADAGDIEQHAICQLALGAREYSDAGWLNDNTCLDAAERRRMGRLTVADA